MNVENPVLLGQVSGLFGVKGWFKVHSYTEPRTAILQYPEWWLGSADDWTVAKVDEGREQGKTIIARLAGVEDRDMAADYVGTDIAVPRTVLPKLAQGTYYWADLQGMTVVQDGGEIIGTVSHLLATGANDVLVVRGDRETLVPFVVGEVIKRVNLDTGVIDVDWCWD